MHCYKPKLFVHVPSTAKTGVATNIANLFNRIQNLTPFTVAAFTSSCFDEGLELMLACKARLSVPSARFGFLNGRFCGIPPVCAVPALCGLIGLVASATTLLNQLVYPGPVAWSVGVIDGLLQPPAADAQQPPQTTANSGNLANTTPTDNTVAAATANATSTSIAFSFQCLSALRQSLSTHGVRYLKVRVRRPAGQPTLTSSLVPLSTSLQLMWWAYIGFRIGVIRPTKMALSSVALLLESTMLNLQYPAPSLVDHVTIPSFVGCASTLTAMCACELRLKELNHRKLTSDAVDSKAFASLLQSAAATNNSGNNNISGSDAVANSVIGIVSTRDVPEVVLHAAVATGVPVAVLLAREDSKKLRVDFTKIIEHMMASMGHLPPAAIANVIRQQIRFVDDVSELRNCRVIFDMRASEHVTERVKFFQPLKGNSKCVIVMNALALDPQLIAKMTSVCPAICADLTCLSRWVEILDDGSTKRDHLNLVFAALSHLKLQYSVCHVTPKHPHSVFSRLSAAMIARAIHHTQHRHVAIANLEQALDKYASIISPWFVLHQLCAESGDMLSFPGNFHSNPVVAAAAAKRGMFQLPSAQDPRPKQPSGAPKIHESILAGLYETDLPPSPSPPSDRDIVADIAAEAILEAHRIIADKVTSGDEVYLIASNRLVGLLGWIGGPVCCVDFLEKDEFREKITRKYSVVPMLHSSVREKLSKASLLSPRPADAASRISLSALDGVDLQKKPFSHRWWLTLLIVIVRAVVLLLGLSVIWTAN
eukprot:c12963_g1_i1.p1 GENE.c12963_g1_i1~~c12963_g1_i1.p1  ORF type:complete len:766 (+),score=216.55 c12963_g1_i1:513-2810(+)